MKKENLVINLIKDDLTNVRLVSGLDKLGLDSTHYYLDLSQTFFDLMGFTNEERDSALYEKYFTVSKGVSDIDIIKHPEKLDKMARSIYKWLRREQIRILKNIEKNKKHGKRKLNRIHKGKP